MRRAISWMIHQSCRACPGGWSAWRPSWTRRSVFVNVPVFSGKAVAGQDHVGEGRRLGQEDLLHDQVLEAASASRTCWTSGSDIAGFSPMMYIPLDLPSVDRRP